MNPVGKTSEGKVVRYCYICQHRSEELEPNKRNHPEPGEPLLTCNQPLCTFYKQGVCTSNGSRFYGKRVILNKHRYCGYKIATEASA